MKDRKESLLQLAEKNLFHLSFYNRIEVCQELEQLIEEQLRSSGRINLEENINVLLTKRGLPRIKLKKSLLTPLQFILLFFGSLILISFTVGIIAFKSIFPLFEFNEADGEVRFFGGKIVLENQNDFQVQSHEKVSKDLSIQASGSESLSGIDNVVFDFAVGSYQFYKSKIDSELSYECSFLSEEKDFLNISKSTLYFKNSDQSACQIYIPEGLDFEIKAKSVQLKLNKLENNFRVFAKRADVYWWTSPEIDFNSKINILSGSIEGDINKVKKDNARYQATIEVESGLVKLK